MATRRQHEQADTPSAILDIAERLVQERGFNGFSYGDVATELGITRPALHYHFPGKAELGEALIERYAARFTEALNAIDVQGGSALDKLRGYSDLYRSVLRNERMCLCGMLAAEYQTLPVPMRDRLVRFFDENYSWLSHLLETGRTEGSLEFAGNADEAARTILGTLEGAMLVARPYGNTGSFEAAVSWLIGEFSNRVAST